MTKRFAANSIYALSMLLIIVMRIVVSSGALSGLSALETDAVWSVFVQIIILGLIPFTLYLLFLKARGEEKPLSALFKDFGYTRNLSARGWAIVIIISLIITFLMTCVSSAWSSLLSLLGYQSKAVASYAYTPASLICDIILTGMLPAVFEEFANRGLIFSANRRGNAAKTILLTALMFALMHTNVTQVFYTFLFGIAAGGLVYVTRSIWPAVLLHYINNFVSVMKSFGRLNGNFLSFLSEMYNWLLGTPAGSAVSAILILIGVTATFFLFVRLADTESERRLRLNLPPRDEFEEEPPKKYDSLPLTFALTLNALVTVITLVWGIIR